MDTRSAELTFDALVVVATLVAFAGYPLGVLFDPAVVLVAGAGAVTVAAVALLPPVRALPAVAVGVVTLVVGGAGVPAVAVRSARGGVLELSVAGTAVVLLLGVGVLHRTAFHRAASR